MKRPAICSAKQAAEITTLHRDTILRKSRDQDDDFPETIELSPGRLGFVTDELYEWLNRRISARRSKASA